MKISSLFGLAPLRFETKGIGFKVSLSNPMSIYSNTLITLLLIFTIFGMVAEIHNGVNFSFKMSSKMSQFVCVCDILMVSVTAAAGVYGAPKRMRRLIKLMKVVASIDRSIAVQHSKSTERKLCFMLLCLLLFFLTLLINDLWFYSIEATKLGMQWDVVTHYLGFYLLWCVVLLLELQFAFTALLILAHHQAINDALALTAKYVSITAKTANGNLCINRPCVCGEFKCGKKQINIMRNIENGELKLAMPACEAIHHLSFLYSMLYTTIHGINQIYGLPLMLILMSTWLHLIVTPYYMTMEIIVSSNRSYLLVLLILWCVTHIIRMFAVVEPCHYTVMERKRTEDLVRQLLLLTSSNSLLASKVEFFFKQLVLLSVKYTPMGVCDLDRPLIATVLGAVTTYLVIIIQFQGVH